MNRYFHWVKPFPQFEGFRKDRIDFIPLCQIGSLRGYAIRICRQGCRRDESSVCIRHIVGLRKSSLAKARDFHDQLKKRVAPVQVRFPKTEVKLGCSSDLSNIA